MCMWVYVSAAVSQPVVQVFPPKLQWSPLDTVGSGRRSCRSRVGFCSWDFKPEPKIDPRWWIRRRSCRSRVGFCSWDFKPEPKIDSRWWSGRRSCRSRVGFCSWDFKPEPKIDRKWWSGRRSSIPSKVCVCVCVCVCGEKESGCEIHRNSPVTATNSSVHRAEPFGSPWFPPKLMQRPLDTVQVVRRPWVQGAKMETRMGRTLLPAGQGFQSPDVFLREGLLPGDPSSPRRSKRMKILGFGLSLLYPPLLCLGYPFSFFLSNQWEKRGRRQKKVG